MSDRVYQVYIAGPLTSSGDMMENVANAAVAFHLIHQGHPRLVPMIPHLSAFLHFKRPKGWEYWMAICRKMVHCADAMVRLPGVSRGAEEEVALAKSLGIPVYVPPGPGEGWIDLDEMVRDLDAQGS